MDQTAGEYARFFELVSGIQIRARRTIEAGLRVRGLTYAQYTALLALSAHDGMSQAELAQALDTDSTTAMVLRTSLERKGLVDRVDDPADGRVKRIEITDSGKSALQGAGPEARNLYGKAGALLSEAELKKILPALERIYAYVGETAAPHKDLDAEPRRKGRPRKDAGGASAAKGRKAKPAPAKAGGKAARPASKVGKNVKKPLKTAKTATSKAGKAKPAAKKAVKPASKAKAPAKRK
jgi:DNA-binding MarR family transcriptional regulator